MTRIAYVFLLLATCGPAFAQVTEATVQRVGTLSHFAISESSGLVASRNYPGILWTHNDGGFQFVFAVNEQGKKIGEFQVGGNLVDWEDIAVDNKGNLYLADIGTNGVARTHVAVHRVVEPNPFRRSYGNLRINRTWLLRFPEGRPQDCESFFVHGGAGYLISKRAVNGAVGMYRFSLADRRRSVPLRLVARLSVDSAITAASLSPDAKRLALTSSDGIFMFFLTGSPATASFPGSFFRFNNNFMEGGTFFRDGFMTSAETRQLWFFSHANFRCRQAPRLTSTFSGATVDIGGAVNFRVIAEGCPFPLYQWRFNGIPIPGATNTLLSLSNIIPAQAGTYEVVVANSFGTVSHSAVLTVRTKPDIRITEVMPSRADDATVATEDWFELTNFELVPVDLSGWRFNDRSGDLTDPFVIPEGLEIQPGETIIFVENLSREQFLEWWGSANVPEITRIVTYSGPGLSFSGDGDRVLLWDDASTDPADIVTQAVFGPATPGVSFIYDPTTDTFGAQSELGRHGAVKASSSSDIGSPGKLADF